MKNYHCSGLGWTWKLWKRYSILVEKKASPQQNSIAPEHEDSSTATENNHKNPDPFATNLHYYRTMTKKLTLSDHVAKGPKNKKVTLSDLMAEKLKAKKVTLSDAFKVSAKDVSEMPITLQKSDHIEPVTVRQDEAGESNNDNSVIMDVGSLINQSLKNGEAQIFM